MPTLPFTRRTAVADQIAALQTENARLQAELTEARTSLPTTGLGGIGGVTSGAKAKRTGFGKVKQGVVLYETYKAIPWISAPIDVIANRMTSGGFDLEPTGKGASNQHKQDILDLLLFMNEEEDFVEDVTVWIQDLFILAEFYGELAYAGKKPAELYYIDPVGMNVDRDTTGTITGYHQDTGPGQRVDFTVEQIVHGRLRGPRGLVLSPIEKLLTSALTYNHMVNWWTKYFENGAKPPFALHLGEKARADDVDAALAKYEELYAGAANAHKQLVTWGQTQVTWPTTASTVELDFLNSAKFLREQMLAVLGVPPAEAGVTDDGNRLSDVSHSADKRFRNNTIDPRRRLIEEKLTYKICQVGFGYDDWVIRLKEADYEDDELLVNLVVQQVNAGLMSRDEGRGQLGHDGTIQGGAIPSISLQREIVPVADLATIHGSQFAAAQQAAANSGMPPGADPDDLATQSPNQPGQMAAQLAQARVQQAANPDQSNDDQNGSSKEEARADLARWQRLALRSIAEGTDLKPFTSESIDPVTRFALEQSLPSCRTDTDVRELFDIAFADVR